ncbi:MAG: TrkH family potassium uptake protein [Actinobacteria bacterium]|nr:TrkH family potassium uptake protein [Actinomycetota bacterium]
MNVRFVAQMLSLVVLAIGAGILASAAVAALYGGDDLVALLTAAGVSFAVGIPLHYGSRLPGRTNIGYREGFLVVGAGWLTAMVFGALPFLFYGMFGVVDSLFETMSGFTTTGASVLVDYDQPHGIMFWRSLTHWYGGMGIIVLFIALLPPLGGGAIRLFSAEAPGPVSERLTPRIKDTARGLWYIYVGVSAVEVLALMAAGMSLYDAATHTFGTMATGGFSPRATSIAAYDSWAIEAIITFFMVVAGGNFALYFAFAQGDRLKIWRDPEFRLYLSILAGSIALVTLSLVLAGSHAGGIQAFREALFQVVSIQSTTGYVTADFDQWNTFAKTVLVMLMFVGGSAGSTAGGFKVVRILLLAKNARHDLMRQVHPTAVLPVKVAGRVVPDAMRTAVLGYFFLYVLVFAAGVLLVSIAGSDIVTSTTAVVATLNNIGPGLELVGPVQNYALIAPFGKVVLIGLMVMGRLELIPILLLFTRGFWRR